MKKYLKFGGFALIFLISLILRFDAYITNNSFFTDEVLLAGNVLDRNYLTLIFPLNFFQSAPYLFLVGTKFLTQIFGFSELVFRFIPFVSSILSFVLFYFICDKFFKNIWCKYIALLAFGINYQLLFYTQTFKQYSTDVLFVVLTLFLIFKYHDKLNSIKGFSILGIYSFFAMFCSFPMFFVLPAVYVSLIIEKPKKYLLTLYSSVFYIVGAIVYYIFNLRLVQANNYLQNYWAKGFQIFSLETYKMNFDFIFFYEAFGILLAILVLWGLTQLAKEKSFYFKPLFFTILFTLIAAGLKLYPFERRLALFLLPVSLLLSLVPLNNIKKNFVSAIIVAITTIFFASGFVNFSKDLFTRKLNYLRQDVKPLLETISTDKNQTPIYLYYGSVSVYGYYSLFKNLPKNVIYATYPQDENQSDKYLLQDLSALEKGEYYLLFVKGTNTYSNDVDEATKWLKLHTKILQDNELKSARLLKVKI